MLLLMLTFIIQFNLDFLNTGFFEPPDFSNYFVGPLGVRKIEVELYMFLLPTSSYYILFKYVQIIREKS